jgi:hypothetical protein
VHEKGNSAPQRVLTKRRTSLGIELGLGRGEGRPMAHTYQATADTDGPSLLYNNTSQQHIRQSSADVP